MFSLTRFSALSGLTGLLFSQACSATACNNSPDLCDRNYNNVTYLGAHDSPFLSNSSNGYTDSGNQFYNTTVQSSAGVRLSTGQVHNANSSSSGSSSWHLCHTSCSLYDAGLLSDWLSEIKTWMDSNPNEVVTILLVNSDDASASELQAQYATADIEQYAYTPESTTSAPSEWPTLQTSINNGTRLLNFVASLDASSNIVAPYLMDEFTFIFENNYDNSSPSNFSCTANRPASVNGDTESALEQNSMPLMNHFSYSTQISGIETPDTAALNTTNAPSGGEGNLGDTAANCTTAYGRPPTYISVDFFNVGPAITTVDNLNNVTNPTGRTNVSTAILSLQSTSGAQGRRSSLAALLVTLSLGVVLI